MTKEEFVEMLSTMSRRSSSRCVIAARHKEQVGSEDVDDWASLLENVGGRLYVDDSDEEPTRENGTVSTRLYALDEIDTWPEGLFEKLSGYIWWIDPDDEIPILDVLATTPRDPNAV